MQMYRQQQFFVSVYSSDRHFLSICVREIRIRCFPCIFLCKKQDMKEEFLISIFPGSFYEEVLKFINILIHKYFVVATTYIALLLCYSFCIQYCCLWKLWLFP